MAAQRPSDTAAEREDVLAKVRRVARLEGGWLDAKWLADKEVVMAAVGQNGFALRYAEKKLLDDKEVVLTAVGKVGAALQYTKKTLRADKEVVMTAVRQDGGALEYANKTLQADKEVVMTAVRKIGLPLQYARKRMRADKEVVLTAVRQSGVALQYADETLQADKEVVMTAVGRNWSALEFVHKDLLCDLSFCRSLIDVLPMDVILPVHVTLLSGRSCFCFVGVKSATLREVLSQSAQLLDLDEVAVHQRGELVVCSTGAILQNNEALRDLGCGPRELQLIIGAPQ